jgi:hypothetical protein
MSMGREAPQLVGLRTSSRAGVADLAKVFAIPSRWTKTKPARVILDRSEDHRRAHHKSPSPASRVYPLCNLSWALTLAASNTTITGNNRT